jgi:hypothetical protein
MLKQSKNRKSEGFSIRSTIGVGDREEGDFPAWQTLYTYFRNWRKDETWLKIHDSLREWERKRT